MRYFSLLLKSTQCNEFLSLESPNEGEFRLSISFGTIIANFEVEIKYNSEVNMYKIPHLTSFSFPQRIETAPTDFLQYIYKHTY